MIYRVFNEGNLGRLACGYRSVIAMKPGRKWVVIIDWTTLEHAKVPLSIWDRLKPIPTPISHRKVKATMRLRLAYVEPTDLIKQAIASL